MKENSAQISVEYLLIIGSLILIMLISTVFIFSQHELNIAMIAARNGVNEGLSTSQAIYPEDTFRDYSKTNPKLLHPYSIEIINISYEELGFDENYDKKKIQFKVYAKINNEFDKKDLVSIGDRINYNLRKSIASSFNTTHSTNKLYNPVFSQHYIFTTANVKWI